MYTFGFNVTSHVPPAVIDGKRETWKVERMLMSRRFHAIAFREDACMGAARVTFRTDKERRHTEVFVSAPDEDVAFRAARAYANAAIHVAKSRRAEFEISSELRMQVSPIGERLNPRW